MMNDLLQLRGQFQSKGSSASFGPRNIPVNRTVDAQHINDLANHLKRIKKYWQQDLYLSGALISVYYNSVIAKSNRIKSILSKGSIESSSSIKGSRFFDGESKQHVFIHYVSLDILDESIKRLDSAHKIVLDIFEGEISHEKIESVNNNRQWKWSASITKTNFVNTIVDCYYVDRFEIDTDVNNSEFTSIISLYQTDTSTKDLLGKIGISITDAEMIDETTIRLNPNELRVLKEKMPYLISMSTYDLSKLSRSDLADAETAVFTIPKPKNEPIIGVIDTCFHDEVYFSEWVTYEHKIDPVLDIETKDYFHGTAITSIIVDGPSFNPQLDDGCGRFRVKHFGVARHERFSSFTILKTIREIVIQNPDIKVWNLSLGSALEISENFISPEAAELDKLQNEYDIIFVVAGTNKNKHDKQTMRIGAPADSLNSIVVNAVDKNGEPASYHRVGPVLSFFHKPDISYYSSDSTIKIIACTHLGEKVVSGTSFATPWITRKVAFLIYVMGFSREIAKALIIDASAQWDRKDDVSHSIGYGVVPRHIEDIIKSKDDEIRFILQGKADNYETYAFNIPVPTYRDKHPFYARATLCYFPKCSRSQGVDYTDTEVDFKFGRIRVQSGKAGIKSINNNVQGEPGLHVIYEEDARKLYRKWDNVKLISERILDRRIPRAVYESGLWGLKVTNKTRHTYNNDKGITFGIVITLKEMNGVNRIDEFIKMCMTKGWIVNRIDIETQIEVFNIAEQKLELE